MYEKLIKWSYPITGETVPLTQTQAAKWNAHGKVRVVGQWGPLGHPKYYKLLPPTEVNASRGLGGWNTWSPAGASVWEGLRGITLLEMCYCREWALRFQKARTIPRMTSFPACRSRCEFSACSSHHEFTLSSSTLTLWNCNSFIFKLLWSWPLSRQ